MEILVANISGKTRKEILNGREYIVAPMCLISPGVLNGSKGPLLYEEEEIALSVNAWNHMPLVVYHPEKDGRPISARTPEILNSQGIGFVFQASVNPKLVAEGWFDIEATQRIDNRILDALDSGTEIELSTGLFSDSVPVEEGMTFNGKAYTHRATNLVPDHLAILPDQIGACSIADGCGVLVNKKEPTFNLTDESWLTANQFSHSQLHDLLSKQLRSRFTQDDPHAWITEVFDDFIVYWQGDDLFKLSYTKSESSVTLSSETPQKVVRETNFVTVANEEDTNPMASETLVNELVANCSCWGEDDKKVLNQMSDDKVKMLIDAAKHSKEQETITNAAKNALTNGVEDKDGNKYTFNTSTGKWDFKQQKEALTNNSKKEQTDEQWLSSAPVGIRTAVENAMRIQNKERTALVDSIVANVDGEDNQANLRQRLESYSFDQLEDLALVATTNNKAKEPVKKEPGLASFFGRAGGAPTTNSSQEKEEPMVVPTINWSTENS